MDERQPDEPVQPEPDEAAPSREPAQAGDSDPLGGDEGTQNQLQADNAVEEDMLKALDPDADPG